ncbi:peroxiredoxin [Parvibaculum sp.]|uniref:peroxiredoxin n=1 Tax=Parvibaculum sp. TaxID=2024848 RepID=UPI003BA954DC
MSETRVPEATLMKLTDKGPQPVKTGDFFKGRKVVVFALPGAFHADLLRTSTCPGFIKSADEFKGKGVDEIACLSGERRLRHGRLGQAAGRGRQVTMLGDGNGDFTKALGLDFDGSGFGMGTRSLRYSMLVDDGVVKSLNKEPNPGEAKVSGAETMLQQLS